MGEGIVKYAQATTTESGGNIQPQRLGDTLVLHGKAGPVETKWLCLSPRSEPIMRRAERCWRILAKSGAVRPGTSWQPPVRHGARPRIERCVGQGGATVDRTIGHCNAWTGALAAQYPLSDSSWAERRRD